MRELGLHVRIVEHAITLNSRDIQNFKGGLQNNFIDHLSPNLNFHEQKRHEFQNVGNQTY